MRKDEYNEQTDGATAILAAATDTYYVDIDGDVFGVQLKQTGGSDELTITVSFNLIDNETAADYWEQYTFTTAEMAMGVGAACKGWVWDAVLPKKAKIDIAAVANSTYQLYTRDGHRGLSR